MTPGSSCSAPAAVARSEGCSPARQRGGPSTVPRAPWRSRRTGGSSGRLDAPLVFGAGVADGPEADEALALAADLAAAAHAPLRVFWVVDVPFPCPSDVRDHELRRLAAGRRHDAERQGHELIEALADTELTVLEGDPVERLTEASTDLDLLVVGSRRYGPVRRVLLGGVSVALIDHAHCPVLVVPRGVHAETAEPADTGRVAHA